MMRKYAIPLMASLLINLCEVCHAHGNPEDLGHHWQVAKYVSEVRLQTVVMLVFILCVVAIMAFKKMISKRKDRI